MPYLFLGVHSFTIAQRLIHDTTSKPQPPFTSPSSRFPSSFPASTLPRCATRWHARAQTIALACATPNPHRPTLGARALRAHLPTPTHPAPTPTHTWHACGYTKAQTKLEGPSTRLSHTRLTPYSLCNRT